MFVITVYSETLTSFYLELAYLTKKNYDDVSSEFAVDCPKRIVFFKYAFGIV